MFSLIKFLIQNKKFKRIMLNMISSILVFAFMYFICGKFATQYLDEAEELNFFNALYFSLVTQSTVGYGDLLPTNWLTKSITMLQLLVVIAIIAIELV
jgi:hypothetical protein